MSAQAAQVTQEYPAWMTRSIDRLRRHAHVLGEPARTALAEVFQGGTHRQHPTRCFDPQDGAHLGIL